MSFQKITTKSTLEKPDDTVNNIPIQKPKVISFNRLNATDLFFVISVSIFKKLINILIS